MYGIPMIRGLLPICYCILIIIGIFIYRIEHSRLGKAMDAIRTDKELALCMGINPKNISIFLQVTSGALCGLSGSRYAFTLGFIRSTDFGFTVLLYIWTMLFVGGHQTMWGVVISAPILWVLTLFLPSAIAQYTNIIYGIMLTIILILRPDGIITKRILSHVVKSYG